MAKKDNKAARNHKTAADSQPTSITGDTKMETIKSSETKQGSLKKKTNGSKSARPKPGRLAVTDLRADTFVMTRKKTEKPVEAASAAAIPETVKPKASRAKSADAAPAAKKTGKAALPDSIGPKKQYIKAGKACKVTFRLPKAAAPDARTVNVVGDFNNWNISETKMKKLKNGDFTTTLELPCNREYRFRYLIDASRWENDWHADKYIRNMFGGDDSVVVIESGRSV